MRKATRLTLLAVLGCALSGGTATAVASSGANGAASSHATVYAHAVAGKMSKVQAAAGPASQPVTAVVPSRGARSIPRSLSVPALPVAAPRAAATPLSSSAGPSGLMQNFNGTSSRDSEVTNFGQEFEPPDQGLCAGNGFVVDMVNSAYTVYKPNGTVVTGPFNINGPFDEGLLQFTSDPRCYYDASTNTWFATILFISDFGFGDQSHLDISVNPSGDPTKIWTTYQIDTTDLGGNGCPCLGDQPTLGIDAQNLYVTTNEFSLFGPQYNGAQVYAISKSQLVSLSPTVNFVHFSHLSIGGAIASSVQPAITTGKPGAEYFLNSLDPTATFDQRIGVWAMTNIGAVTSGGIPTFTSTVLNSEAYGVPPFAEQKGTFSLLNPDDDRMQQTQFIDGHLYGELTTALTIPGDPTQRAGAAWFDVSPRVVAGVISNPKIARQGYVAVSGNYFLYPAMQVAGNGEAAMVGTLSSSGRFPSAAFARLAPGASAFGPVTVAARGTTHYDPNATRWGDYSWAVLDPSGNSFWLATEYIPPLSSQTTDRAANWGTRVLEVSATS